MLMKRQILLFFQFLMVFSAYIWASSVPKDFDTRIDAAYQCLRGRGVIYNVVIDYKPAPKDSLLLMKAIGGKGMEDFSAFNLHNGWACDFGDIIEFQHNTNEVFKESCARAANASNASNPRPIFKE